MFRFLIGYIGGTVIGIALCAGLITIDQDTSNIIFFSILWLILLAIGLYWSHKYHIKKRNDYYKKVRGPSRWLP